MSKKEIKDKIIKNENLKNINTGAKFFKKLELNDEYIRKTYYLTPELIKALSLMAAYEGKDLSQIVRESLQKHIPDTYLEQAKKMINK